MIMFKSKVNVIVLANLIMLSTSWASDGQELSMEGKKAQAVANIIAYMDDNKMTPDEREQFLKDLDIEAEKVRQDKERQKEIDAQMKNLHLNQPPPK